MSTRSNAPRGFTLLEFALVLPIFVLFIMAAVDLSRMQQGYAVLDDGLRVALRCVYPANAECISAKPASVETRYDVFNRDARLRAEEFHYSADAAWLRRPIF